MLRVSVDHVAKLTVVSRKYIHETKWQNMFLPANLSSGGA